jgi:hypothetical protein
VIAPTDYGDDVCCRARRRTPGRIGHLHECAGQALAYLTGRLEFLRLRRFASDALGDSFSLKDFHGVVLGGGPMPLKVPDDVVRAWVDQCCMP